MRWPRLSSHGSPGRMTLCAAHNPAAISGNEANIASEAILLFNFSPVPGICLAISICFRLLAGKVHPGLAYVLPCIHVVASNAINISAAAAPAQMLRILPLGERERQ